MPSSWTFLRVDAFCTALISGSDKDQTSEGIMNGTLTPGYFILAKDTHAKRFVDRNFDTISECVKEVGWTLNVEGWEGGAVAVALSNTAKNGEEETITSLASIHQLQDLQKSVREQFTATPLQMGDFLKSLFEVSVATWRVAMQLPAKEGTGSNAGGGGGGMGFSMPLEMEGLTPGQSLRLTMEMQQMEALVMQASAGDAPSTTTTSSNKPIAPSTADEGDSVVSVSPRHVVGRRVDDEVSFVVAETSDDQSGTNLGSIVAFNPAKPAALTFTPPKEENATVEYVYAMSVLLLQRLSRALALVYEPVNPALVEGSDVLNNITTETPLLLLAATMSHQRLLMSNPAAAVRMPRVRFPLMLLDQIAVWSSYNLRAPAALYGSGIAFQPNDLSEANKREQSAKGPPAEFAMNKTLGDVSAQIGVDGATQTTFMSSLREAYNPRTN